MSKFARSVPKNKLVPPTIKKVTLKGNGKFITPSSFKKDSAKLSEDSANEFKKDIVYPILEKRYGSETALLLLDAMKIEGSKIVIHDHTIIEGIDYSEVWQAIEFGMRDKGILANPILREEYPKYKETFEKKVKKMLPPAEKS